MRQPFSRGSPRPRGYVHQFICFFIHLSKQSAYNNHGSFMVGLPYLTADLWIQTLSFQTMHKSSLFQHKFVCLSHPGSVQSSLSKILNSGFTPMALVYCLMKALSSCFPCILVRLRLHFSDARRIIPIIKSYCQHSSISITSRKYTLSPHSQLS